MNPAKFFTDEQKKQIVDAIKEAEKETSGEIRLHIESKCKGDPLERAIKVFQKLKMHKTALRNGTLIYLALNNKKFA
ncbi:MAG: TPM domain-containing protein, partial [Calditrichaeota bacterium]|nr:TPM domain-containing protein [Calditrichota bacterium]